MKAWSVMDYNGDPCGVIVFAEKRNRAKVLTAGSSDMPCSEYMDLSVRRLPIHDGKRTEEGILPWKGNERLYYEAKWYPEEGTPCCDLCGFYQYPQIPESTIEEVFFKDVGYLDVCAACRANAEHDTRHETT